MFEDISQKFKNLKMPEESLIKKIERIKKVPGNGTQPAGTASPIPDMSEHIKNAQEEMAKKIDEIIKSKTEQINASTEAIKEFDVKLNKIESSVSASKNRVDEFKERLDKIDESLLELLSLYEVVSSTVNPFVGEKENVQNEKIEQYDIKFKALETSLEELTQIVNSNPVDQETLIKNISEQVMERIKSVLEQKPQQGDTTIVASPKTSVRASQYAGDDIEVKLKFLNNSTETSIIILNWIEFLLEKVGRNNLAEVLEYYIDIGWISEEVCSKMIAYANGIDYYVERPTWKLLPDDHTKSLMFIEQLKGKKLDKTVLAKLERDMERVVRCDEVYAV